VVVALILIGSPGAGKSSVLEALTSLLEVDGVEFSALESEQLAWGSPWLSMAHVLPQLRAVTALQRDAGRRLFLVAATTETDDDLRGVVDAVGADQTMVVLLVAEADLVAQRINAREPDGWPGKAKLIAHARKLATSMVGELQNVDACIRTDGKSALEVAVEVRDVLMRTRGTRRSDDQERSR
jgi:hypothetical protein